MRRSETRSSGKSFRCSFRITKMALKMAIFPAAVHNLTVDFIGMDLDGLIAIDASPHSRAQQPKLTDLRQELLDKVTGRLGRWRPQSPR